MKNFKIEKSEIIFKGKVFDLKVDSIVYDSGNKGIREVAIHNGGSVVIPVTEEGKIVLVKQYRYPFDKYMIELPAGKLELGEDPLHCAKRELKEETGYDTDNILKLTSIATTPGFCTEILHIYLAKDLSKGETAHEEGEFGMEILHYSLDEIREKIFDNEIFDAKTICGIYQYELFLKKYGK